VIPIAGSETGKPLRTVEQIPEGSGEQKLRMQHGAERRGVTGKLGGHPTIKHLPQLGGQRRHPGLLLTKTIQKA
jgi:hypothetical protein